MRKFIALGAAAAVVAVIPAVAVASNLSSSGSSGINCQQLAWRTTRVSTSSSSYSNVPRLSAGITSIFAMSITFSGVFSGGPAAVRVIDTSAAGIQTVPPGHINLRPGAGRTAFSFTWTDPGTSGAIHGHDIHLQWRKTGRAAVILRRGDITVGYQTESSECPQG